MNKQIAVERDKKPWPLTGDGLWSAGFTLEAFSCIRWLSGLVKVHEAVWIHGRDTVVFLVTSLDKTDVLFKCGALIAAPLDRACSSEQDLVVVRGDDGRVFHRGGN